MILKASAAKGASSLAARSLTASELGSRPFTGGMSSGDGRYSTTASNIGWTPLLGKKRRLVHPPPLFTKLLVLTYHRECAKARLASAIRWVSSFFFIAVPR